MTWPTGTLRSAPPSSPAWAARSARAERGHLDEVGQDPAEDRRYTSLGGIYRAFTRVGQMQVPTIAAVRGAAVGAGINLMLATDLRIVADDARLISGFLRIGLHPGGGHFGLLAGRAWR